MHGKLDEAVSVCNLRPPRPWWERQKGELLRIPRAAIQVHKENLQKQVEEQGGMERPPYFKICMPPQSHREIPWETKTDKQTNRTETERQKERQNNGEVIEFNLILHFTLRQQWSRTLYWTMNGSQWKTERLTKATKAQFYFYEKNSLSNKYYWNDWLSYITN